jgi:transcriptional regulator with XRE-family HTH domain
MDRAFPYPVVMERSKASRTLADNINRLMASRLDLDSNPKLGKRSGLPVSTLSRLRNGNVEATLQVVERLAAAFGVEPSALIADSAAAWPFRRVPLERVLALSESDLAYVEGRLMEAIDACGSSDQAAEDRRHFEAGQVLTKNNTPVTRKKAA